MTTSRTADQRRGAARAALSCALAPFRLVTPLGRATLVLGMVSLLLASELHWQEFTQLGTVALALVAVGLAWQAQPSRPVASIDLRPARLGEGGSASAVLTVRAGGVPMLHPKVIVPVGEGCVLLRLPLLAPFARHVEEVSLPSLPRGVHVVGPVVYERSDPVGMVSRRLEVGLPCELHVSPRTVDLSVLASGLTNDLDGATSQQLSMSDLAFHALREYLPGDDLRHVHWRSSAKAGAMLVRQYHETRHGHMTVLVDDALDAYSRPQDFELAVSVATSIALRAASDDLDTYFACGMHTAHGRHPVAMADVACRFIAGTDDYLERAAEAAAAIQSTGLLVQVSGARRDLAQLDAAASRFGRNAERIVVRADAAGEAALRHGGSVREITVPDLDQLDRLMTLERR